MAALLHGLKRIPEPTDLTAVVTVTDDGGSSGRLRRDFDVLPPGDIRNCMVALAEDETLLTRLFQYRFKTGRGLKGHSFGNLFLTALTDVTGDFAKAVRLSSAVLPIQGRIFPSTAANVRLEAELENPKRYRVSFLICSRCGIRQTYDIRSKEDVAEMAEYFRDKRYCSKCNTPAGPRLPPQDSFQRTLDVHNQRAKDPRYQRRG